jgi:UDP-N-acetyl-D-mannosaminuronic acid dehydrogenase
VEVTKPLPAILQLKSDEVDTPEKRGRYTVSVIGCGLRGVLYAEAFAEAGFKVVCADADQSVVRRVSKGNVKLANREETETKLRGFVRKGQLTATSDLKAAVSSSDVIIMTVGAKIDAKKAPDYSEVENVSKQIGAALPKGCLLVYGGVAGFGFVDGVVKETIENTSGLKVGEDFGFAYNIFQIPVVFGNGHIGDLELRVAAADKLSLNAACLVFGTIAKKGVKRISDVKIAELAALFASAKRDANLALANELAVFCENAGVDYRETLELADGDVCVSYAPTIAEEDNRNEAYLLLESAENFASKLRVTALARQINEDMIKHAANLTQSALRSCGKPLRRARIALLGAVAADTAAAAFVEMLAAKGAKITRYDPEGAEVEQAGVVQSFRRTLNETAEGADCIVILTGQEQFKHLNLKKLRAVMRSPAALIDLAGVIEPSKAESEGFAYRGFGRGVWKK